MQHLLKSTFRRHSRVPLSVLAGNAEYVGLCAEEMVQTYLISTGAKITLSQIKAEFDLLSAELALRYRDQELPYPKYYAVEQGSSLLVYALVRSMRPRIVLETGVANGHSSFFILNAMRTNDFGVLHSTDCSSEVGSLLSDRDREKWRLHVLDLHNLKKSFGEVLNDLAPIDVFLHDSDHANAWQFFELQTALKRLAPGGIVASDDCDSCYAFLDVCRGAGLQPAFLVERSKVFGFACKLPLGERL
jgi:predicted O-methyltransferase YrrM